MITASPAASASRAAIEKLSRAIDGITSTSAAPSTAAVSAGGYGGSNRTSPLAPPSDAALAGARRTS